jgi:hypothetical protein
LFLKENNCIFFIKNINKFENMEKNIEKSINKKTINKKTISEKKENIFLKLKLNIFKFLPSNISIVTFSLLALF